MTERRKAGRIYRYCHCYAPKIECTRPSFREEALSDRLVCVLEGIQLSPGMITEIRELADENAEAQRELERRRLLEILRLRGEIERKTQERIAAGRKHIQGTIDATDYAIIIAEIEDEIQAIDQRIRELKAQKPLVIGDCDLLFELLERAPELYRRLDIEERAKMLRVVTSNLEDTVVPVYREPFCGVAEYVATGNLWACLGSNQGPPAYQASALTD